MIFMRKFIVFLKLLLLALRIESISNYVIDESGRNNIHLSFLSIFIAGVSVYINFDWLRNSRRISFCIKYYKFRTITKMSALFAGVANQPQSLLTPTSVKGSSAVKVFIEHGSAYHKVVVEAEGLTANEAICRAIDMFN